LYLISGSLLDISRYSGLTTEWLFRIAQFICDPRGPAGELYTHNTGTVAEWYDEDRSTDWVRVVPGDPLQAKIYEFEPTGPVLLTQISQRQQRSLTSDANISTAATFRNQLLTRDEACVNTRQPLQHTLVASRLIPKRTGAAGTIAIISRFAGANAAAGLHEFHATIGVMMFTTLDAFVDAYNVGFYHVCVRPLYLEIIDINGL
jgi:hypothetical protein